MSALVLLVLLVAAAAIYDFVNGFQDSANVVATMIASRALSARGALLLAAAGTLAGPFVIGVAVARTVGSEVLSVGVGAHGAGERAHRHAAACRHLPSPAPRRCMMGLFDAGMKESNKFFTMLVENARKAHEAVTYLEGAIEQPGPATIEHLRALSQASIEGRRVLIDELHETIVTPLDREDIYNLSQAFEQMVTYALTTLEEMHLLRVTADEPIRRMVVLAREQAEHLVLGMIVMKIA